MATIELLYRTVEAILSESETGESYLPIPSSPAFSSLNWSTLLSHQWDSRGVQGREPQTGRIGASKGEEENVLQIGEPGVPQIEETVKDPDSQAEVPEVRITQMRDKGTTDGGAGEDGARGC